MSLLLAILQALVLFAVAPLLSGITRVARARMHNRRGPGVLGSTAISSSCSLARAWRPMPQAGSFA